MRSRPTRHGLVIKITRTQTSSPDWPPARVHPSVRTICLDPILYYIRILHEKLLEAATGAKKGRMRACK